MKLKVVSFNLADPSSLAPISEQLSGFERHFRYPLGESTFFRIDHGADYGAFFRRIGDATLFAALAGNELAGVLVLVQKTVLTPRGAVPFHYFCDLKVSHLFRGKGVAAALQRRAYWKLFFSGFRLVRAATYFVAMQGMSGDFVQTSPQSSLARRPRVIADLGVFFVDPMRLASLPNFPQEDEPETKQLLDLSPAPGASRDDLVVDLHGVKDLVVEGQDAPLPFVHLASRPLLGHAFTTRLRRAGTELARQAPGYTLCLALDERRAGMLRHLAEHGLVPKAKAKVYAFSFQDQGFDDRPLAIGTDEI